MKKLSFKKLLITVLCMITAYSMWILPAQAASVSTLSGVYDKNATVKLDITGDNKKDTIKFKFVKEKYSSYSYDKIVIYVNGKNAGSFNPKNSFHGVSVQYLNMSKSRKFLYILGHSDGDVCTKNAIYKYDNKTKKLKCVLNLPTSPMEAGMVTSISSSQIKVAFSGQPNETARINCTFTYVYKNGKFKLKSNTVTAKSALTAYSAYDGYDKYFRNSQYKVSKKLKFYTSPSLKKASFTAQKGDVLKLKKIKLSGKNVYLQFQKGSKTGWRKVFNAFDKVYDCSDWKNIATSGWFYGAYNRLAG